MGEIKLELKEAKKAVKDAIKELRDVVKAARDPENATELERHGYQKRIEACDDGVRLMKGILRRLGEGDQVVITENEVIDGVEIDQDIVDLVEDRMERAEKFQFDLEKVPKVIRKDLEAWREKRPNGDPQDFLFLRLQNLENAMFLKIGWTGMNLRDTVKQAEALRGALYEPSKRAIEVPG